MRRADYAIVVALLPYGYLQARRGVMAADPEIKPRALVLGFIVLTALYLYGVSTTDLIRKLRARLA
jgi:hypothetical protein